MSTSGCVIRWGAGLLKTWRKTQAAFALSSGEAELAAAIKGITGSSGMQVGISMFSDAPAAIGMSKSNVSLPETSRLPRLQVLKNRRTCARRD